MSPENITFASMLSNVLFTYIGWLLAMSVMDMNPTATLLSENGGTPDEETTLMQGDTYTGSAPTGVPLHCRRNGNVFLPLRMELCTRCII